MKKLLIALACLMLAHSPKVEGEIYPRTFMVVNLESETDTVVCIDAVGMEWAFEGIEDWEIGDLVSAIMNDNGTENITDDYFTEIRYAGYISPIESWEY